MRREQDNQRQWEVARDRAIERLNETNRAHVLRHQLERWELASRLVPYVDAMRRHLDNEQDQERREELIPWVVWADDYVGRLDPLTNELGVPPDPQPTPEALQPYMNCLSPHGYW